MNSLLLPDMILYLKLRTLPCTVKPRFTVLRFTGSLDLQGLNYHLRKQALHVNQCKLYPDLPGQIAFPRKARLIGILLFIVQQFQSVLYDIQHEVY